MMKEQLDYHTQHFTVNLAVIREIFLFVLLKNIDMRSNSDMQLYIRDNG